MSGTILIVDDEDSVRTILENDLNDRGYTVLNAANLAEGRVLLRTSEIDVVLLDQKLPDGNGLTLLEEMRQISVPITVIIFTAYGEVNDAVKAMKLGAFDYIKKPFDLDDVALYLEKAMATHHLKRQVHQLRQQQREVGGDFIVGKSLQMREVAHMIDRLAQSDAIVLIQGESGTGKEVVARLIHQYSRRADKPFIGINCAAIPDTLLDSELFGYEAGAFTGAQRQHRGMFEQAQGGTLFLDEISSMSPEMQAKLLRVFESRKIRRVGGNADIKIDVRVITASNRKLKELIAAMKFREDLYFRISVMIINLPPLRDRIEDIDIFAASFLEHFGRQVNSRASSISSEALEVMRNYSWPGNIRELRNVIERAIILSDGPQITTDHLPQELRYPQPSQIPLLNQSVSPSLPVGGVDLKSLVKKMEIDLIEQALARAGNTVTRAAELLSLSRDELRYRMQKYQLSGRD